MAKVKMGPADTKKVKVYPKTYRYITDILLKNDRIEEPMELELNVKEITRAMGNAVVTEVNEDGEEVVLNPLTFNLMDEKTEDKEEVETPAPDEKEEEVPEDKKDTSVESNPVVE